MSKYKHKIPREDLKRFAKEIAKKLVKSDFEKGRVKDPTKIDEKGQKKVKEYCKDYFEKAAHKHKKHEELRATKKATKGEAATPTATSPNPAQEFSPPEMKDEHQNGRGDVEMDDAGTPETPSDSHGLKRKRVDSSPIQQENDGQANSPAKKLATEAAPPPPPPPAPPNETPPTGTPEAVGMGDQHHDHDTNFKDKSMADVRALAQMEDDEDMPDDGTTFEAANGHMENPMVDGQQVAS